MLYCAVIALVIVLMILILCGGGRMEEGLDSVAATPTESIQNLASMYSDGKWSTNKVQLGNKWLLSGVGDGIKDDTWLRLTGVDGTKLSGGFAAGQLWSDGDLTVKGKINPDNSDLEIDGKIKPRGGIEAKCEIRRVGNYFREPGHLDRFPVICNDGEYLQGWHMSKSNDDQGNQPEEFRYKCCKFDQNNFNTPTKSDPTVPKTSKDNAF